MIKKYPPFYQCSGKSISKTTGFYIRLSDVAASGESYSHHKDKHLSRLYKEIKRINCAPEPNLIRPDRFPDLLPCKSSINQLRHCCVRWPNLQFGFFGPDAFNRFLHTLQLFRKHSLNHAQPYIHPTSANLYTCKQYRNHERPLNRLPYNRAMSVVVYQQRCATVPKHLQYQKDL